MAATSSPAWLDSLVLTSIDPDRAAGVAIASVPLPPGGVVPTFAGMTAQALPLAWYPGPGDPRQALILGVADAAPDTLGLTVGSAISPQPVAAPATLDAAWAGPRWQTAILDEKKTGVMMRETNELVLEHAGRRLGIRMGIELVDGGFHWWDWLQVEQLWTGPVCTAVRAAGYIPVTPVSEEEIFSDRYNIGYWLHRHNWLFAEVYAQIFVNGLVRVTARHVNNRVFDQGRDLEGFVPVIAFSAAELTLPETALDGTTTDFALGAVQLDLERATDLISAEHPGRLRAEDGLAVYQPYEGVEMPLGDYEPDDRWNVRAEQRRMWKGMARSVGFDLSFADAPIRTRRYMPPYGWYGAAGALWPDAALPARGPIEVTCDAMIGKTHYSSGEVLRSGRFYQVSAVWDGEYAHALMRQAQRTGRRDLYEAALHHAYAFADIGIDHADYTQQICAMPKGSISLVLQRNLGMLTAYLETGDPYLLRVAESMADVACAIDRGNWPRRSYGRDAAWIRSLNRLYDVTGQTFYLQRAGEACHRLVQCQHADGSFSDQGGATGAHGHLNEIIKPWMNSILSEVMVDYLERAGRDPAVEAALVRVADWLLTQLIEDEDGPYWPYQVAWGRNENDPTTVYHANGAVHPHPTGDVQLDYNARTLLWVSRFTGDPRYGRAWQRTYARRMAQIARTDNPYRSSYGEVKIADNFPWHEAHLWGARWDGARVTFDPFLALLDEGREATVELPDGSTLRVRRTADGVETVE